MKMKYILSILAKSIYINKYINAIQILCLTLGMIIPFFFLCQFNGAFLDSKENDKFQITDKLIMFSPDLYSDVKVLQKADIQLMKQIENIENVYFINRYHTNNIFINNKLNISYSVYTVDKDINSCWKADWIEEGEIWENNNECIIGKVVAQRSRLIIGDDIEIDGKVYIIKGISDIPKYRSSILINQELVDNIELWDVVYYADVSNDIDKVSNEINNWLIKNYGTYHIYIGQEINQLEYTKLSRGWFTSIILSIISLIYSLVNIYNILYFYSIKTRRKLAIILAIGATKGQIFIQKYFEIGINMFIASILSYISLSLIQKTFIQYILSIKVSSYIFFIILAFGQCNALIYTFILLRKVLRKQISDIFRE